MADPTTRSVDDRAKIAKARAMTISFARSGARIHRRFADHAAHLWARAVSPAPGHTLPPLQISARIGSFI
jgi:hypothetical protein